MHQEVKDFIKRVRKAYPLYFIGAKVLECGSQIINGTPRKYFWFCRYTGIDIGPGRGVDIVANTAHFNLLRLKLYDVVISTEMLEHDLTWKESMQNMFRQLRPGGLLIITCAGINRPEHGTTRTEPESSPFTTNYYMNLSVSDFLKILPVENFASYNLNYQRDGQDVVFFGQKAPEKRQPLRNIKYFIERFLDRW